MSKPRVLILGGVGFIGRNLVQYLVENDLASHVRVVDKAIPAISHLSGGHKTAFESGIVEFKQADLSREAQAQKAFESPEKFDFVVNLAAESKYGQEKESYEKNILGVANAVGAAAAAHGPSKFVEVSHAGVYDSKNKKSDEGSEPKPWTLQAEFKLKAEEALKAMNLPLVVLRPAIVYGPGDIYGISPRLICARVYKHKGKPMKFLWGADLKINTVHVHDVVRAIWHACTALPPGKTFNLADKGDTSQGSLNACLEEIFEIKTGFQSILISKAASLAMKTAAAEINEEHMEPWSELCTAAGIANTPLTPYLDVELLYNKHMNIEGSAIEGTGFAYERPQITAELLKEQVNQFVEAGLFPQ